MANGQAPATASWPISPPLATQPIGQVDTRTPGLIYPTLQFLKQYQELWAAIAGTGGSGSIIISNPWTPILTGSGTSGANTYTAQWGRYVSAGALVVALFNIKLTVFDPATAGSMQISGLPIDGNSDVAALQAVFITQWGGLTLAPAYTQLGGVIGSGGAVVQLYQSGNGAYAAHEGTKPITASQCANNLEIVGGAVYCM